MKKYLIFVLIFFCIFFVAVFVQQIIFSNNGMIQYFKLKKEIIIEKEKINNLDKKIKHIQEQIDLLTKNDFYLEKLAREELLMGRANEKVFLLN